MSYSIKKFLQNQPSLLWGTITFSPLVHFYLIFNAIDAQRGRLHLLFEHNKQWDPPAKTTKNATLSVL
jgi:hypothetical protein